MLDFVLYFTYILMADTQSSELKMRLDLILPTQLHKNCQRYSDSPVRK